MNPQKIKSIFIVSIDNSELCQEKQKATKIKKKYACQYKIRKLYESGTWNDFIGRVDED